MPPRLLTFADRARSYLAGAASSVPFIGASISSRIGPAPPTGPFSGEQQGPANPPALATNVDQPVPTPDGDAFKFDPRYHGHTFQNTAAPVFFGNMSLARARAALEMHDAGATFLESSIFAVAAMRFPPVYWALGIRCAPLISLPRHVLGGPRGLSRVVASEVEDQIARRNGLLPSPYFPSTLWGAIAIDLAMMGFSVLQHVYGPQDARGIRRIYTRRWPTWAVYFHAYRRTYIALTNDGPIDITNDGKFTIIGKTDVPHLQGAIRALVLPTLDGAQVMQARGQWIDRFADPKLAMFMPEKVNIQGPEGQAMYAAAREIRGPGGFGVFPHGSAVTWTGLDAKSSSCFKDSLGSDSAMINSILTGVDTGADGGVYKPLVFWGILRSTVGDDLACTVRGVNLGHVYPYTRFNYAEGIEEDEDRGVWLDPVLSVPLPDPEKDARITEDDKRAVRLIERVNLRRAAGIVTTQEDADAIADALETPRVVLADVKTKGQIFEYHIKEKQVAPDEVRDTLGLDPMPGGVGSLAQLAEERAKGLDKTGQTKITEGEGAGGAEPAPVDPPPGTQRTGQPPAKGGEAGA